MILRETEQPDLEALQSGLAASYEAAEQVIEAALVRVPQAVAQASAGAGA